MTAARPAGAWVTLYDQDDRQVHRLYHVSGTGALVWEPSDLLRPFSIRRITVEVVEGYTPPPARRAHGHKKLWSMLNDVEISQSRLGNQVGELRALVSDLAVTVPGLTERIAELEKKDPLRYE
jgi:hypothetical protein